MRARTNQNVLFGYSILPKVMFICLLWWNTCCCGPINDCQMCFVAILRISVMLPGLHQWCYPDYTDEDRTSVSSNKLTVIILFEHFVSLFTWRTFMCLCLLCNDRIFIGLFHLSMVRNFNFHLAVSSYIYMFCL